MYAEPKHFRIDEVPNMRDILDPLASRCVALESENMAFLVRPAASFPVRLIRLKCIPKGLAFCKGARLTGAVLPGSGTGN